ncbi:MAG: hypothetical protein LBE65_04030 [Synergistaceae bacterium]|nr:hypothetical protein [Synergistaceae bacterium]
MIVSYKDYAHKGELYMCYRLFCLAVLFFAVSSAADGGVLTLPEIEGWRCGDIVSARLEAFGKDYGYFERRVYRTREGLSFEAVLTCGAGPKFFNQPPAGVSGRDGETSYEIISVNGYKTSLEYDPTLGLAVSMNAFDEKYTLTLECGPFETSGDLIGRAETLMAEMEKTACRTPTDRPGADCFLR